ncbi:AMP-binding protein [Desulfobacter postgatei]|uniref:AMP-binding protein n=1 Tax=Desulfobacter postgatei TaxID=2293 RepID=UPI00259BC21F|nr:AMP-binding protein [uncultured Desulfobacter sp.]
MESIELCPKLPARLDAFRRLHRHTLDHREQFWAAIAEQLQWQTPFSYVVKEDFSIPLASWFWDGQINAAQNALHRIIEKGKGDARALVFYQKSGHAHTLTFNELKDEVLRLAAAFHRAGLTQGDCIALNLPNCPEFVISALAAAYLGITYLPIGCHLPSSIVAEDITASRAKLLIMANSDAYEEKKSHARTVRALLEDLSVLISGETIEGIPTLEEYMAKADPSGLEPACPQANHPLFTVYENRLAGKHVGSVFPTGGFLVQAHASFDDIFNKALDQDKPQMIVNTLDIYKAPAQAYGLWGPLTNGTGIILIDEDIRVNTIEDILNEQTNPALLCPPTLISEVREQLGQGQLNTAKRFSVIASCGNALPPRLVKYADSILVKGPERVVNLWVQSKSGIALLNSYPTPELNRPGTLGFGALGVEPIIINDFGEPCKTNISGNLVFSQSWPAMPMATPGTTEHFKKTYFSKFQGYFFTYDGVRSDKDGFFWFMGRLDDSIKVKGQSLGASLIEGVLTSHPLVEEAAIISTQNKSGEDIVIFVVPRNKIQDEQKCIDQIKDYITDKIGHFAVPKKIIITDQLPKTATGKLFRSVLRRIAAGEEPLD